MTDKPTLAEVLAGPAEEPSWRNRLYLDEVMRKGRQQEYLDSLHPFWKTPTGQFLWQAPYAAIGVRSPQGAEMATDAVMANKLMNRQDRLITAGDPTGRDRYFLNPSTGMPKWDFGVSEPSPYSELHPSALARHSATRMPPNGSAISDYDAAALGQRLGNSANTNERSRFLNALMGERPAANVIPFPQD